MQGSTAPRQAFHMVPVFIFILIAVLATASAWGQGGTIVGTVHLAGKAPTNPLIRMGADPNCLKLNAGKRVFQEIVVQSADGGLGNAFVHVAGSFPNAKSGSGSVTLDQQGCNYHPRILGAQVGQTLIIKNDDSTLHNVHSISKLYHFDQAQPTAGLTLDVPLKAEEVVLHVKCNVHPWMTGFIGIVNSPYFAVSDDTGKFKIENVPAGKQTIEVWQERYGPLSQTVEVKPGTTVTADFSYTGNEPPPTAASKRGPVQEITIPDGTRAVSFIPPIQ
jgi:plastocyanin